MSLQHITLFNFYILWPSSTLSFKISTITLMLMFLLILTLTSMLVCEFSCFLPYHLLSVKRSDIQ